MPLLEVEEVSVRFGGVVALDALSFSIDEGQICALIGPNGAGKTTLFNVVSRLYEPTSGRVTFAGEDLLAKPPHAIATAGIARTFQNVALCAGLSVLDNVLLGAHSDTSAGFVRAPLRLFGARGEERAARASAMETLERLELDHLADHPASGLPYGTLKRIELARALLGRPRMLMLDEPATGLTHSEVDDLGELIRQIPRRPRPHGAARRAPHEHGHDHLRRGRGRRAGIQDRRGATGRRPERSPGHRGLFGSPRLSDTPLLAVEGLEAGYGPVQVLRGLDFSVGEGEAVVILGANGAGKTTTIRAVSGVIPATAGTIALAGDDVTGRSTDRLVRLGVAHVPQGRGTFVDLTVQENMELGAYSRSDGDVDDDIESWYEVFPRLGERRDQAAGSMSGGEQQMLAIARAAMSRPTLLLLDEPSLGLAPLVTQELFRRLAELNQERGTALLIVEQNASLALGVAERAYVLEAGTIVASGTADEIGADESVRRAYLGY